MAPTQEGMYLPLEALRASRFPRWLAYGKSGAGAPEEIRTHRRNRLGQFRLRGERGLWPARFGFVQ